MSSTKHSVGLSMLALTCALVSGCKVAGPDDLLVSSSGASETETETGDATTSDTSSDETTTDDPAPIECPEGVIDGSVVLTTNEQVAAIEGCTRVTGGLGIEGTLVSDLSPLHALAQVDGDFTIRTSSSENNPDANGDEAQLTTLAGLEGMRHVGSTLSISSNPRLEDISALAGLEVTDQYIMIRYNTVLTSLHGLEGVTHVPVSVFIEDNPALETLEGLENLASVSVRLHIRHNPALFSLALPVLSDTYDLTIEGNVALTELSVPALTSLSDLTIGANDILPALAGIDALEGVSERLTIILNKQLPQADAQAWADARDDGAYLKIGGNLGDEAHDLVCPWVGDGICDEPELCGVGTDSDCV